MASLTHDAHIHTEFQRGFIGTLTLRWEEFKQHHELLRRVMPVREVQFTTRPTENELWFIPWTDAQIFEMLARNWPGIKFELPPQPAFRNYTDTYTNNDPEDFRRRMREAAGRVVFHPPIEATDA